MGGPSRSGPGPRDLDIDKLHLSTDMGSPRDSRQSWPSGRDGNRPSSVDRTRNPSDSKDDRGTANKAVYETPSFRNRSFGHSPSHRKEDRSFAEPVYSSPSVSSDRKDHGRQRSFSATVDKGSVKKSPSSSKLPWAPGDAKVNLSNPDEEEDFLYNDSAGGIDVEDEGKTDDFLGQLQAYQKDRIKMEDRKKKEEEEKRKMEEERRSVKK